MTINMKSYVESDRCTQTTLTVSVLRSAVLIPTCIPVTRQPHAFFAWDSSLDREAKAPLWMMTLARKTIYVWTPMTMEKEPS
jgi:hypothetical protein